MAVRHLFAIRLNPNSLARALLFGVLGWMLGMAGPVGAGWLLLGLPCVAIVLTLFYAWLEGLVNVECLMTAARLGGRRAREVR